MKKLILRSLALLLVLGLLAGGTYWYRVARFVQSTDDAYIEANTTVLSPEITGVVTDLAVADNQPVRAGDVVLRIDDKDYVARVAQARATLEAQKAAIAAIDAKVALERPMIAQNEAGVVSAEADLKRVESDYVRYSQLAAQRVASVQQFENTAAERTKAHAALDRAKASLEAERRQLAVLQASRAQAQGQLDQAAAQLELVEIDLARTVIRAPVDGIVGNRGVQLGQYVRPGQQLLSIVQMGDLHVTANFKETQLAALKRNQPVEVTVDAFPNLAVEGRVESLSPATGAKFSLLPPENATGNFTKIVQRLPVRISLPADSPVRALLRPGLSATVRADSRAPGDGPLAATTGTAQVADKRAASLR